MPKLLSSIVSIRRKPSTRLKALKASCLSLARLEENTGTKAEVSAPSATKLRSKLGMRKATKNASA